MASFWDPTWELEARCLCALVNGATRLDELYARAARGLQAVSPAVPQSRGAFRCARVSVGRSVGR